MKINSPKIQKTLKKQFRKTRKKGGRDLELESLLKEYTPPEIQPDIRKSQITQLTAGIRNMDYLSRQTFAGQIMTQLSFISCWVWLAQTCILFLIFYNVFQTELFQLNMLLSCLAPGLSLILIYEISKSFRVNIWEMEAACRYNLAQIFFFRLCILFGGDFLVLTAALIAYRMADGLLWQFCYYALLPFFLTSAVSLFALRRIGNRCNSTVLAIVPLLAGLFYFWAAMPLMDKGLSYNRILLSRSVPIITTLALFLLLYNALKLCNKIHFLNEKRKDHNAWNFE